MEDPRLVAVREAGHVDADARNLALVAAIVFVGDQLQRIAEILLKGHE